MLRQNAALNTRLGRAAEAAKALEELRQLDPEDRRLVAQLMQAYAQIGPAAADKARELGKQLPDPRDLVGEVDVDALERANWAVAGAKLLKKQAQAAGGGTPTSPKSPKQG
jgi:DNA-binding SARP family transcriptional activator